MTADDRDDGYDAGESREPGFWSRFRPDARISARTFTADGVARGGGPIFLRPRDDPDGDDFPLPDEPLPDDPCFGRPHVRAPLVAAQLRLRLGELEIECPPRADLDRIRGAVRSEFGRLIANPDVRVVCRDRLLTIGVWPAATDDSCDREARGRGLAALDLIEGTDNFGFFLSSSLISRQARRAFAAGPRRLASNGAPSRSGPIHLTRLEVVYEAPQTVKTLVHGFDDRPWPDVGFTLTISDLLERNLQCASTQDIDTHGVWKAVVAGALLAWSGQFPLALFVLAGTIDAGLNRPESAGESGVGCRALGLVPAAIPLPERLFLNVTYTRTPQVTRGGLFFGGVALRVPREPSATLEGPSQLAIADDAPSISAVFRVETFGTFGTLSFRWSGSSGVVIDSPTAAVTTVRFRRGEQAAGASFTRQARVTVSDQDGFETTERLDVDIVVIAGDEFPPICRIRPKLPQCRP